MRRTRFLFSLESYRFVLFGVGETTSSWKRGSMNKTCAISSWISFLMDIKHKEVAQRENHRLAPERRAQLGSTSYIGPVKAQADNTFMSAKRILSLPSRLDCRQVSAIFAHSSVGN